MSPTARSWRWRRFPNYDVELVRRRHQPERVEGAERQPRSPARQPGDAGRVRAGFDVQAGELDRDDAVRDPRLNDTVLDKGTVTLGKDKRGLPQRRERRARPGRSCRARSPCRATCTSTRSATTSGRPGTAATRTADSACRRPRDEFGFGAPTGVELDEAAGTVPDPDVEAGPRRQDLAHRRAEEGERRVVPRRRHLHSRSVRATWPSRRCSSRMPTPRSRTVARCGSRTSSST